MGSHTEATNLTWSGELSPKERYRAPSMVRKRAAPANSLPIFVEVCFVLQLGTGENPVLLADLLAMRSAAVQLARATRHLTYGPPAAHGLPRAQGADANFGSEPRLSRSKSLKVSMRWQQPVEAATATRSKSEANTIVDELEAAGEEDAGENDYREPKARALKACSSVNLLGSLTY